MTRRLGNPNKGLKKPESFCPKCLTDEFKYRRKAEHIGKYCANCHKWIKWATMEEVENDETLAGQKLVTRSLTKYKKQIKNHYLEGHNFTNIIRHYENLGLDIGEVAKYLEELSQQNSKVTPDTYYQYY